jgi:hypothetical protein
MRSFVGLKIPSLTMDMNFAANAHRKTNTQGKKLQNIFSNKKVK